MYTFLYEDIFVLFGVPREIITNQGPQFASHLIKNIMQQFKIKHHMTTLSPKGKWTSGSNQQSS